MRCKINEALENKFSFGKLIYQIRRCKINKALQNKFSVAKYTQRFKKY
jgi:hypothetical protein